MKKRIVIITSLVVFALTGCQNDDATKTNGSVVVEAE